MLQMIMQDEDLQRKMFVTAQQEHDRVYKVCTMYTIHCLVTHHYPIQALSTQIENVQENLMLLTILENNQKEMEDEVLAGVHSQRTEMAELLTRLMVKQEERRSELEETAKFIEQQLEDEQVHLYFLFIYTIVPCPNNQSIFYLFFTVIAVIPILKCTDVSLKHNCKISKRLKIVKCLKIQF